MGLLGTFDLAATTDTTVYTVPGGKQAAFSVNLCNRSSSDIKVRIALTDGSATANKNYIEYDTIIPANGMLERTGIVMADGEKINAYASATGISAVVYGVEE